MIEKKISVLGSTGSIGTQTLEVITKLMSEGLNFEVVALASSGSNIELLKQQIELFTPQFAAVYNKDSAYKLKKDVKNYTEILAGEEGIKEAAAHPDVEVVVAAISGFAGLIPTYEAVKAGKKIALANKETLVAAGHLFMEKVKENNITLIPIDSEHSAVFQCLKQDNSNLKSIILTASGGALKDYTLEEIEKVKPEKALKHPNWSMGRKITIDSATLMNKGLEVIEARWLFDVEYKNIEVVIHPQSIIHSMVRYIDGSILAHLGVPDMKAAIQYSLTYPNRVKCAVKDVDFVKLGKLTFEEPRWHVFPCLELAFDAGKAGGNMPAVLNSANEAAVNLFLEGKINFNKIPSLISKALESFSFCADPSLDEIIEYDKRVRSFVEKLI